MWSGWYYDCQTFYARYGKEDKCRMSVWERIKKHWLKARIF